MYRDDKGAQLRSDFEAAGFKNIKMWEQAQNIYYKDGEHYMKIIGDSWLKADMEVAGMDPNDF